ncbi:hypothetical protein ACE5IS_01080 [Leptospira wolffii]|uniref:Uncharacterized protein n=1 Tax=Leptospira wolffii TaxID=409998 RepID=A0ABV5BJG9_9LEPT|nr:hypothetical protein [Leptospira wolffii]
MNNAKDAATILVAFPLRAIQPYPKPKEYYVKLFEAGLKIR